MLAGSTPAVFAKADCLTPEQTSVLQAYTTSLHDQHGHFLYPGTHQIRQRDTAEAVEDKTRVTVRMVFPSAARRDIAAEEYDAIEGAKQSFERLGEHLPKMGFTARQIVIERIVDAPPALIFQCWTDPKHRVHWWAPHGFTNPVCELDPRVGGKWRIVTRGPDGAEYPCHGIYHEIVPNERLVFTNNATGSEGNQVLDRLTTVTFADANGKTRMRVRSRAIAVVAYAAKFLEGMEIGWTQSLERLDIEVASASR